MRFALHIVLLTGVPVLCLAGRSSHVPKRAVSFLLLSSKTIVLDLLFAFVCNGGVCSGIFVTEDKGN